MARPILCIAGRNELAISGLLTALKQRHLFSSITVVLSDRDDGVDRWQPSFRRFVERTKCADVVTLSQMRQAPEVTVLSLEFDRLIDAETLSDLDVFNLHFSLLPAYKGMYTSCHPILNDDRTTGCTLHRVDAGIDTGPILAQRSFQISADDTAKTLYRKYSLNGRVLLEESLTSLIEGRLPEVKQPSIGSTYFSRTSIDYRALKIDVFQTADQIRRQVNAYNHRSYQLVHMFGLPISKAEVQLKRSDRKPGTLLAQDENIIRISTIDYDCEMMIDRFDDLIRAIRQADLSTVESIVGLRPDLIEETSAEGWTPLIVAAYNGKSDVVRALLHAGSDPNACNLKGTSPLMYAKDNALQSRSDEIVRLLIEAGADPDHTDIFGRSVLDYVGRDDVPFITAALRGKRSTP